MSQALAMQKRIKGHREKPRPHGFKHLPLSTRKRNLNKVIEDAKSKTSVAALCAKYAEEATGLDGSVGHNFYMAHMCIKKALVELAFAQGYVNREPKKGAK